MMVAIVTPPAHSHVKSRSDYPRTLQQYNKPKLSPSDKNGGSKTAASSAVRIRLLYHIIKRQAQQRAKRLKTETSSLVKPKPIRCTAKESSECGNSPKDGQARSLCDCSTCFHATESTRVSNSSRLPIMTSRYDMSLLSGRAKNSRYYDNRGSLSPPFSPVTYYNALILNSLRAYHMTAPRKESLGMWRPWI